MLDADHVDRAIRTIRGDMPSYRVAPELLGKFTAAPYDQECLGYLSDPASGCLRFLPLLVRTLGLRHVLELGNRVGLSTVCLYSALAADGRLTTVDIEKDQRFCPDAMFEDPRVTFAFGDVADLSIYGTAIPIDIDLLFLDTIHFDFQVRDEYSIYQHLLADDALIAIDDINTNDKRRLFDELPFSKWDLTELCHDSGFGLILFSRPQPIGIPERVGLAHAAAARIWKRKHDEVLDDHIGIAARRLYARTKKRVKRGMPLPIFRIIQSLRGLAPYKLP